MPITGRFCVLILSVPDIPPPCKEYEVTEESEIFTSGSISIKVSEGKGNKHLFSNTANAFT